MINDVGNGSPLLYKLVSNLSSINNRPLAPLINSVLIRFLILSVTLTCKRFSCNFSSTPGRCNYLYYAKEQPNGNRFDTQKLLFANLNTTLPIELQSVCEIRLQLVLLCCCFSCWLYFCCCNESCTSSIFHLIYEILNSITLNFSLIYTTFLLGQH